MEAKGFAFSIDGQARLPQSRASSGFQRFHAGWPDKAQRLHVPHRVHARHDLPCCRQWRRAL
jgi:hypothetical protein